MNILICDDEKETLNSLRRFLIKRGYNIVIASSKQEAVKQFKQNPIDLVFLDILIPGTDGFEIVRELKKFKPDVTVIMMTACVVREQEAEELGVFDYLYKPFDLDKVIWLIEKVKQAKHR